MSSKLKPEKEFPKVEKMLYDLAWQASNPHFHFEEARSEAYVGFMKAIRLYDRKRGTEFSTWCHFVVERHLKSVVTRSIKKWGPVVFEDQTKPEFWRKVEASANRQEMGCMVRSYLKAVRFGGLSKDAQLLVEMLLETPREIATEVFGWDTIRPVTPQELLDRACENLGFERGLDREELDNVRMELVNFFA